MLVVDRLEHTPRDNRRRQTVWQPGTRAAGL